MFLKTTIRPLIEDLKQYQDRLQELEAFIKVDEAKSSIPDIQTRILRRKLDYDSKDFFDTHCSHNVRQTS